jgi:hypothetical protein
MKLPKFVINESFSIIQNNNNKKSYIRVEKPICCNFK